MNIGEIQSKLNTDLTELCEETARLKGLRTKQVTITEDINAAELNLEAVRERVADLQANLTEAIREV